MPILSFASAERDALVPAGIWNRILMSDLNAGGRRADMAVHIGKAVSAEDIAAILADIGVSFNFINWFVRDIPVGGCPAVPGGFYVSNVDPAVASNLDQVFGHRDNGLLTRLKGLFTPSTWHIRDLDRTASPQNEAIWNVLKGSSMDFGICFPALDVAGGGRVICFTGVRDPLSENEIEKLNYLVIQIHGRISVISRAVGDDALQLVALELECLSLAAAGHNIEIVARRVGLSVRTVQYINSSICRKMDVLSVEHAVAVALRLGIIR